MTSAKLRGVRVTYWIAALLVLSSFPAYSQTQAQNTNGNATTHPNSAGATAAEVCSGADKGEAGHFAALYPWYVHAIQSKVREKWREAGFVLTSISTASENQAMFG